MIPNGATIGGQHTYDDLGLIPKSILQFVPPEPKCLTQPLNGADGELDYTEFLTGRVQYNNRKGTFEFKTPTGSNYQVIYNNCLLFFDGSVKECVLDDEPDGTYKGRFWVSDWKSWEGYSLIVIEYDVEPYRYSDDDISELDWKFNEVLELGSDIFYGSFNTNGKKARTLINPNGVSVAPSFTCSAPMQVVKDGVTYRLPQGQTNNPGFVLDPGDNELDFTGTGTVGISYDIGITL